jgi:ParB family chromosome partitioning protein
MSQSDGAGAPRRGLAKGLSALLADVDSDAWKRPGDAAPHTVPIEFLRPGPAQPRRRFDAGTIEALAESIRAKGILQPLLVRRDGENPGAYEIVAGERRWRAAQLAQVHDIPIVVRSLSDREALEVGLVENVQREDLTAIEEAGGYRRLIDEFDHSQQELASIIGKSRSHVANTLRLLGLPDAVKAMIDDSRLSAGHGRALLAAKHPADLVDLAKHVVSKGLNVRQTEALVRRPETPGTPRRKLAAPDANIRAIERSLGDLLGLGVKIHHAAPGGTLTIRYRSLAQLDDVLRRLGEGD